MTDSSNRMNSTLKGTLETLRDSSIVALCLAILMSFGSGRGFRSFAFLFVDIWIYSTLIMFLAWQVLPRLALCIEEWSRELQWTLFVITAILISAVGSAAGSILVSVTGLESGIPIATLFSRSFSIAAVVTVVIGVNEVAFVHLREQLESTKLKLRTEELERERALKLATAARLSSLEARLHPHFLFNTLNSISSLIPVDPLRAERMVERMAALLRFSFDSHRGGVVPLEQELKIVQDYLEIEQARLGPRLRYSIETIGALEKLHVPPFSVQTLVENSIKFAIAPSREGGEVQVRAARRDGSLWIDVSDTGPGFDLRSVPEGHGLDNLRGRLTALFGDAAALMAERSEGRTVASMRVPA
jgi:sensor histidine kinase YesM